jgi:hypothetical protein
MYESQIISYLVDLMEEASRKGFQYPIIAVIVSADSSILVMKWKTFNHGDPDFEYKFTSIKGPMKIPINVMLVDAHGKGARALIENRQSAPMMIN